MLEEVIHIYFKSRFFLFAFSGLSANNWWVLIRSLNWTESISIISGLWWRSVKVFIFFYVIFKTFRVKVTTESDYVLWKVCCQVFGRAILCYECYIGYFDVGFDFYDNVFIESEKEYCEKLETDDYAIKFLPISWSRWRMRKILGSRVFRGASIMITIAYTALSLSTRVIWIKTRISKLLVKWWIGTFRLFRAFFH